MYIDQKDFPKNLYLKHKEFSQRLRSQRLFVRENKWKKDWPAVAVIGTRKPSKYAFDFVGSFVKGLFSTEINLISGGAFGVDALLHKNALKAGIPTQAYLVGEQNKPYPRTHLPLFREILESAGGALIIPEKLIPSEKNPLYKSFWIKRNEWLVAAADVLIVVEAKIPSGTWSSVCAAQAMGVSTYILPGSIFSLQSRGTLKMIEQGYGEIISSLPSLYERLKEDLGFEKSKKDNNSKGIEAFVQKVLAEEKQISKDDFFTMSERLKITLSDLLKVIAVLEARGSIQRVNDNFFCLGTMR